MVNEHKVIKIAKRLNKAINEELENKGSDIRFNISTEQFLRSDKTYLKISRIDNGHYISLQLHYYINFTDILDDEVSTIRFLTEKYENLLNLEVYNA